MPKAWRRRPGLFGENLTVEGLDLSSAIVGERWTVGSTVLEVAQPRLPCYKLGIRVGDQHFLNDS
jgi:MOSC domain-containing protein YiiM